MRSKPILKGFVWSKREWSRSFSLVWSHWNITVLIYLPTNLHLQADFWEWGLFLRFLSECDKQSHHFANLNFCDVTLLFSIHYWNVIFMVFNSPLFTLITGSQFWRVSALKQHLVNRFLLVCSVFVFVFVFIF